jgi:hypothetical protein
VRLSGLDRGHRGLAKVVLSLLERPPGSAIPDVVRTLLYRPAFFGGPLSAALHPVMRRRRSRWSRGERELFAAYTSRLNQCPF